MVNSFNLLNFKIPLRRLNLIKVALNFYSRPFIFKILYEISLGNYFCIDQLSVNCIPPNKPVCKDFGHISFSHCDDKILLGWSTKQSKVDIEK